MLLFFFVNEHSAKTMKTRITNCIFSAKRKVLWIQVAFIFLLELMLPLPFILPCVLRLL